MTFYQSDQFKTFYTRAQTFEFIWSKKGCQHIFQKHNQMLWEKHKVQLSVDPQGLSGKILEQRVLSSALRRAAVAFLGK